VSERVVLVAINLNVEGSAPDDVIEAALTRLLPRPGTSLYDQGPGHFGQVESWWVAEDERHDGSDNDSAVFVTKGSQRSAFRLLHEAGLSGSWNNPDERRPDVPGQG